MKITQKQIDEIKENFEKSEFHLTQEIIQKSESKEVIVRIDQQAIQMMAIEHPMWDPDGDPQYLGRYWVKFLIALRKKRIEQRINESLDVLHEAICVKYDFCKKKKTGKIPSEELDLAVAVADSLISSQLNFPLPITLICVYLVKNQIVNRICKC